MKQRDILFRGKTIYRPHWVYGLCRCSHRHPDNITIRDMHGFVYAIHHESLHEYSGLTDSTKWDDLTEGERGQFMQDFGVNATWKGRKIFEADALDIDGIKGVVVFNKGAFCLKRKLTCYPLSEYNISKMKVIGNITNSPELFTKYE